MPRLLLLLGFLAGAPLVRGETVGIVEAASPLVLIDAKTEITVGKEMSMVSSQFMYQYVEKDDFDHRGHLIVRYPLYIETGLKSLGDVIADSSIKLQVGEETIEPKDWQYIPAEQLSDWPVPEDTGVVMLTFDIPRTLAHLRFILTLSHIQPNYHYKGKQLAAYTPWMPRFVQLASAFVSEDDFVVTLKPATGLRLKPFSESAKVFRSTPTELSVVPEHRRTIAVEVIPE